MTSKRVTLVADELLGYVRTGGIGTATSFLAIALARMGHRVEVLYVGRAPNAAPSSEWASLYDEVDLTIRHPPPTHDRVDPPYFAQMRSTESALAAQPPDVVIAQDLAAPAYTALRLRRLGLAFQDTLFVVMCHGTRRWVTDTSRKVRVLPNAQAITVLEQASVELADVVVSPSRYLVDWMRTQDWDLPKRTAVIPYFTRSAATGESPPPREVASGPMQRIVFFGRLEERKGLRPFLDGMNALDASLLRDLELEFLGRATPAWPPQRIEALLSAETRSALGSVSFETDLDQHEALARLARPGTLAVLPSFGETFGNAVRECLDHGIPFLASDAGAVPELVAAEDRERALFPPTAAGVADALRRTLASDDGPEPAHPAVDEGASWSAWEDLLLLEPSRIQMRAELSPVDVVVSQRGSGEALHRCLEALAQQRYPAFSTIVVTPPNGGGSPLKSLPLSPRVVSTEDASPSAMRRAGTGAGNAPWVLFLDDEDIPDPGLLETLVRAQAASGADVVSCGLVRASGDRRTLHFFAGEPRGLGVLANGYGTVALLRRTLLQGPEASSPTGRDHDWPLLARLSASGAHVVSVPIPLATTRRSPGDVHSDPVAAMQVVQHFETALPSRVRSLARVAAGLAAEGARAGAVTRERRFRRVLRRFTRTRT